MSDTEHLTGIIEIETFLQELDFLLAELELVEAAVERLDGRNVTIEFDSRGDEALLAKLAAMEGASVGQLTGGRGGGVPDALTGGGTKAMTEATEEAADSLGEFDLRMTDLHNALARMVPLLLTVIGALPALIAGLAGLAGAAVAAAAALFGIAGFGALGFAMQEGETITEGFQEILSQIRSDFLDAFTPLANQLAPLFRDALDGLNEFFQSLANNGDALRNFEQAARSFGGFLVREMPDAIAFLATVARTFTPVFERLSEALFSGDFASGFMEFMADVLPALTTFGALVADMTPMILDMSIGFLRVTNAILSFLDLILQVLTVGGRFSTLLGVLIGSVLTAATAQLLWNTALLTTARSGFASVIAMVAAYVRRAAVYVANTVMMTAATQGLAIAVLQLVGYLTLGIGALVAVGVTANAVASQFQSLTTGVTDASQAVRNFDRTTSRVGSGGAYAPNTPQPTSMSRRGGGSSGASVTYQGSTDDADEIGSTVRAANFTYDKTQ